MGIDAGAIRELTEALDGKRPAQQPTVARARVVQADGGGTWVQLDGGAARTPVASSTVAVRQGDEVMVRIDGGNAVVTGNISRPSTDDSALNALQRAMDTFTRRVSDLIGNVSEIRQSADSIATRVENVEGSVASMEQTAEGWSWVTSVKNQASGAASAASEAQSTANAASTAAGNAATAAANAQSSADEAAKTATNYMSFTIHGLIVGDMTEEKLGRNVCINDGGVHVFYEGSTEGVNEIAHLGYGEGNAESGTANAPYYTFGGRKPNSAIGNYSVTEGDYNEASGACSHASGLNLTASGNYSHAEGHLCTASGFCSHAEGQSCTASGDWSHAQGYECTASGGQSHAGGYNTTAASDNQTAIGRFNVVDSSNEKAFIIGNGTSDVKRSNAFTVDWDGNVEAGYEYTLSNKNHAIDDTSTFYRAERTDVGRNVAFGIGSGGSNAGYYDSNMGKWIVHSNGTNTYLNGACVDVTSSTTASDFFTPYTTNVTSVNSGQVSMWGKICQVHVSVEMKTAISAGNISNTKIGTLKREYRPKTIAALTSGTTGPVCSFHVDTDGSVYVDATHSAVSAGGSISFGGTFILA